MKPAPKFIRMWLGEPLLSLILILCLVIGMSVYVLITVYLSYQLSWDRNLSDYQNTYRMQNMVKRDVEYLLFNTSIGLARTLKGRLPQIKDCYAISPIKINFLFTFNDNPVDMSMLVLASKNAPKGLGMKMIYGDIDTCLDQDKGLLVSHSMAIKTFGDRDPLGEVIHLVRDNQKYERFIVSGVFEDFPENQHIQSDFFFWSDFLDVVGEESTELANPEDYLDFSGNVYYVLEDGADSKIVEREAQKIFEEVRGSVPDIDPDVSYNYALTPLKDTHYLTEGYDSFDTFDRMKLMKYGILAVAILLVLITNTIILLMVRIMGRRREIDIRRSLGASSGDIVRQFIGEHTTLYSAVLVLSGVILWLILPHIRQWIHGLPQHIVPGPSFWLYTISGLFVGGLITILYPAVFARMMLQDRSKSNQWKLVMVIQLTLSLVLLTSAILLNRQIRHIESLYPGFNAENVHSFFYIVCQEEYRNVLMEETWKVPGVEAACFSDNMPTHKPHESCLRITGEKSNGEYLQCPVNLGSHEIFDVFKIQLVKGRLWDTSESNGVIVNEAFMQRYAHHGIGLGTVVEVGKEGDTTFFFSGEIIGIVKNVWWDDVRRPAQPMVYCNGFTYGGYFHYRIRPGMEEETLTELRAIMLKQANKYQIREVEYDTQYEIEHNYDAERAFLQVVGFATIIGLFFTFVGVYGLTAFTLKRQLKNLAVRKVYGASSWDTLKLLLRDYLVLLGVALGIAIPVSFYALTKWLGNFSIRIELGVIEYALSLAGTFVIVLLAVVIHWRKLNRVKLIDFLRTE